MGPRKLLPSLPAPFIPPLPAGACCPAGTATPHPHRHDHDASAACRAAAQHGDPLHRQRADQHAAARARGDRGLLDARDRPARQRLFRGLHPGLPQRAPRRAARRPHQDVRDAFQRHRRHGARPRLPHRPHRLGRAALFRRLRVRRPLRRDRELAQRPRRHGPSRRDHVRLHLHQPLRADGGAVPADGLRPGGLRAVCADRHSHRHRPGAGLADQGAGAAPAGGHRPRHPGSLAPLAGRFHRAA